MNQETIYVECDSNHGKSECPFPGGLPHGSQEAIIHLQTSLQHGKDWSASLLEAMGLWTLSEEVDDTYFYRYLIQGEAFDWLLLAKRLLKEIDNTQIPIKELRQFQKTGTFPREISLQEIRYYLGSVKFRAYLNYWYGITVESAIQLAVQQELRKDRISKGFVSRKGLLNEVFNRLYKDNRVLLYSRFKEEHGSTLDQIDDVSKYKEFTYWLFKTRLGLFDGARIASDTTKGLEWLQK
ncbi:hypothetical protein FIM02_03165 [SAR202 cluster bacterium AD-802-E10_MRT_200m]|nr:hypothetical protein [SAR202 cluster bacterium AD-802-E10_MRT_200m]